MSIESRRELPMGLPRALTPAQVAKMLQVDRKRVYEAIQQGHIRAVRIGKQLRIPTRPLLDWLEHGEVRTAEPEVRMHRRQ